MHLASQMTATPQALVETDAIRVFRAVRNGEGLGSDNEWQFLRVALEKGKDLEPASRLAGPSA